jgi:hypothetical protein
MKHSGSKRERFHCVLQLRFRKNIFRGKIAFAFRDSEFFIPIYLFALLLHFFILLFSFAFSPAFSLPFFSFLFFIFRLEINGAKPIALPVPIQVGPKASALLTQSIPASSTLSVEWAKCSPARVRG